jgi:hypothetical protein
MKKKILIGFAALAVAAVAAWNVNTVLGSQSDEMSELMLANVEALANNEFGVQNCPGGSCSYTASNGEKCTACCPVEKNPKCNGYGCECNP